MPDDDEEDEIVNSEIEGILGDLKNVEEYPEDLKKDQRENFINRIQDHNKKIEEDEKKKDD